VISLSAKGVWPLGTCKPHSWRSTAPTLAHEDLRQSSPRPTTPHHMNAPPVRRCTRRTEFRTCCTKVPRKNYFPSCCICFCYSLLIGLSGSILVRLDEHDHRWIIDYRIRRGSQRFRRDLSDTRLLCGGGEIGTTAVEARRAVVNGYLLRCHICGRRRCGSRASLVTPRNEMGLLRNTAARKIAAVRGGVLASAPTDALGLCSASSCSARPATGWGGSARE
jgi:hypothetical protein